MKTIARTLIAGLVASVILGNAATSHAQRSARSLFNQVAKSYRGKGTDTFQIRRAGQPQSRNFGGGFQGGLGSGPGHVLPNPPGHVTPPRHGHPEPPRNCHPEPPCHGSYCPPPRCYVYVVYYYDCHYGWRTYRTFHRQYDAQHAVEMLQHEGYRAYYRQTAK